MATLLEQQGGEKVLYVNELLKLSEESGEQEGTLTGMSYSDNLSISFNLCYESSHWKSIPGAHYVQMCQRNHRILHMTMRS